MGQPIRRLNAPRRKGKAGAKAAAEKKRCSHCWRHKPKSQFYSHASMADGLDYWCRTCRLSKRQEGRTPPTPQEVWDLEFDRRMRDLSPSDEEFAVWIEAKGRWGQSDPSPDDVLAKYYGTENWMPVRRGAASLVTLMAQEPVEPIYRRA